MYAEDFDTLLSQIVADYTAIVGTVTEGDVVWIKSACLASMLWGIYQYQQYIADQPFVGTCSTDNLNHWGNIFGLARLQDEIDSDYSARITDFLRNPPSGGNINDYRVWAKAIRVPAYELEDFPPNSVNVVSNYITTVQGFAQHDSTGNYGNPIPSTVKFSTTGTLPTPLQSDTIYYTNTTQPLYYALHKLQVSDSPTGNPITITDIGSGLHSVVPQETTQYGYKNVYLYSGHDGYVVIYGFPTDTNAWVSPVSDEIQIKMLDKFNELKNCLSRVILYGSPELITMTVTISDIALVDQIRLDITQFFRDNIDFLVYRERILTLCVNAGDPSATTDKPVYGIDGYFPILSSLVIKDQDGNIL